MKLKKKRPYWTYWFLVWHQTHLPVARWPGTGTGSGLCGWPWTTSVSESPRSHCQSATQWTCRLWDSNINKVSTTATRFICCMHYCEKNKYSVSYGHNTHIGELTNSFHGVSLLDQKLGSGDVDVHAERLLLFVNWLCWTCVFTGEHKTKIKIFYQKLLS